MIAAPETLPVALTVELNRELQDLYERVRRSVALVYRPGGNGAGTIWNADGLIVTNNHVVNAEGEAMVVLHDGRRLKAIVADRHPTRDLALLKVAATDLPAIEFADSTQVRPGQIAIAMGHPHGYRDAMTFGVVIALENESYKGKGARGNMLLSDAGFSPGNSGGPVVDADGRLIGICSRVAGKLGMSVPGSIVQQFARASEIEIQQSDWFEGVVSQVDAANNTFGLVVTAINADFASSADYLLLGDVILSIDGVSVTEGQSAETIQRRSRGVSQHTLTLLRGGKPLSIQFSPELHHP